MPGSSLWLLPPRPDHPFAQSLDKLITDTVPSNYPDLPAHPFLGHLTLTSNIDPSTTYTNPAKAQAWLDALPLPTTFAREKNEAIIEFETLEAGDPFFEKLVLRAKKDANLLDLAAQVRAHAAPASKQTNDTYSPHLSLLYADTPTRDIEMKMHRVELQLGFEFGSLFACCGGMLAQGARFALVDTSAEVAEWKVLAEREVDWVVWRAARALV